MTSPAHVVAVFSICCAVTAPSLATVDTPETDTDKDLLLLRLQQAKWRQEFEENQALKRLQRPSSSPVAILFQDNDNYIYQHTNGRVQLRDSAIERRLVELLQQKSPKIQLRPGRRDQKPVIDLLVDVFSRHHHHRRPAYERQNKTSAMEANLTSAEEADYASDEVEMLLYLADVIDLVVHDYERLAAGAHVVPDVGTVESRLERIVDELTAAVEATDPGPQREPPVYINPHKPTDANETMDAWMRFENGISQYGLYTEDDEPLVDELIETIMSQNLLSVDDIQSTGTNLKLIFTNEDGSKGVFKPKRQNRDHEVHLDLHMIRDFERHYSEIAAYHLDRVLGFRHVPPAVGTRVSISQGLHYLLVPEFQETFYESPAGNQCFYGICKYYCNVEHSICGEGDVVEGSISYFVPNDFDGVWSMKTSPWRRSYVSDILLAEWETGEYPRTDYCDTVRQTPPFDSERTIANMVDLHIFDFLQGNLDRHHVHTYQLFGNESFIITFDNGRGFGRSKHDELSILAPLYQCCTVRLSTVKTLLDMQTATHGGRLSDRMRRSLRNDPLSPVITEAHLEALDRRVAIILDQIHRCLHRFQGQRKVIVDY